MPAKRRINLHTSDMRKFKECRRQWRYASPLWYNKAPVKTPLPLARGKTWHKGLEGLYIDGLAPGDVFREAWLDLVRKDRSRGATYEIDEVNSQLELGETVLNMYVPWAKKHDNFKVIEAEQRYYVPLIETNDAEVFFAFRCDQVIEKKNGLWIHDFKSCASLPTDPSYLDFDEQITGYLKACEIHFDKPFVGAVFTYLLTKMPTEPEELKGGGLSINKKIYTTPEVFYRKLLELNLDPRDYKDFLKQLEARCQWFVRFEVIKSKAEKEILWKEHQQLAYEMIDSNIFIYKSANQLRCQMCSFKSPCLMENAGRDFEIILEREFVNGEEW